jgi:hypothetical protein
MKELIIKLLNADLTGLHLSMTKEDIPKLDTLTKHELMQLGDKLVVEALTKDQKLFWNQNVRAINIACADYFGED